MKKAIYILLIFLATQCREKYDIPIEVPAQGYLVVEGYINSNGASTIRLSATNKLSERHILPQRGAVVTIQGDDNSVYPLYEQDSAVYTSEPLTLSSTVKYRIDIKTQENKEYLSSYTMVKATPEIDSLTYLYNNNGVEIYVNSHDPGNSSRYYEWSYEETWEFNSAFRANLTFRLTPGAGPVPTASLDFFYPTQTNNDSIFTCWKSDQSDRILIGSTDKLVSDVVYLPLVTYPKGSWQLSRLYSIKVTQKVISKEAYEFLGKMKKNSENLGTLFDAQPSEIVGNITCVSNPGETVIGNIEISEAREKRLFISNSELPGWGYDQDCVKSLRPVANDPDSIQMSYTNLLLPTVPYKLSMAGTIISFSAAPATCVDCTLRGTNNKPSFWP